MKPTTKKPQCANPNGHAFNQPPIHRYRQTRQNSTNMHPSRRHPYPTLQLCALPKSQPAKLTISPKRPTPTKHDNPNRQSMARNQPQNSLRQADLSSARLHRTQHQHGLAPVRNRRLENLHPRNRKPTTQTVKTLFKDMTTRRPNARTRSTPLERELQIGNL